MIDNKQIIIMTGSQQISVNFILNEIIIVVMMINIIVDVMVIIRVGITISRCLSVNNL